MSISPVGQEESLTVEDVFNDQQLVNNRMAREASNIIIDTSVQEVGAEDQPADNSSEEIVANIDTDSFGPTSPVDVPKNNLPDHKKPQS